jgi:hypothetical protein
MYAQNKKQKKSKKLWEPKQDSQHRLMSPIPDEG